MIFYLSILVDNIESFIITSCDVGVVLIISHCRSATVYRVCNSSSVIIVKTNISPRAPLSSPHVLLHVLQLIVPHAITVSENFGNIIIILAGVDVDKG